MLNVKIFYLVIVCVYQISWTHSQSIVFEEDSGMVTESSSPNTNSIDGPTENVNPAGNFLACYDECQSRVVKEFNPVCGTNGFTYRNRRLLKCAQDCGLQVTEDSPGVC